MKPENTPKNSAVNGQLSSASGDLDSNAKRSADDGRDDRILGSLRRIIRAVDLYSRYLALRYSLTGPQLVCVRQLLKHGSMAPGALARLISLSPATVTGIIDRLEKRNIVTRERSKEDKRKVLIALTPEGERLVEKMPPPLHEAFSRRLEELSEDEQEEIDRVLARIVDMMEAQDMADSPLYATDAPLPATTLSPFLNSGHANDTLDSESLPEPATDDHGKFQ